MTSALQSRWSQLILGIVCMVMIANLQYGWTLFVLPIDQAQHFGRPAIQVAFTVFVLCETWLLPLEGYVIDKLGPRLTVGAGGVLIGAVVDPEQPMPSRCHCFTPQPPSAGWAPA